MVCVESDPVVPDDKLTNDDDCGTWEIVLGERLLINITVTEEEAPCEGEVSGGVTMPYSPIYSNQNTEDPKWTFDVRASSPGSGGLDVSCDDGTTFEAFFEVVE